VPRNATHSRHEAEEAVLGYMREIGSMAFLAHYTARGFGADIALEIGAKINYAFLLINGATTTRPEYNLLELLRRDDKEEKLAEAEPALWTAEIGIGFKSKQVVGIMDRIQGTIAEPESEFKFGLNLLRGRIVDTAAFV
jgi:hypothetical protein